MNSRRASVKSLRFETQDHWLLCGSGLFVFVGHPLLKLDIHFKDQLYHSEEN